jgi:prepilin-type N-terminal cleavage/methylation domain-containing protein
VNRKEGKVMQNKERGFTLVEVLVSIVLLSMTFVLFYQIMGFSSLTNDRDKKKQEAIEYANEILHVKLSGLTNSSTLTDLNNLTALNTKISSEGRTGQIYIRNFSSPSPISNPEDYVFLPSVVRVQNVPATTPISYTEKVLEVAIKWRNP